MSMLQHFSSLCLVSMLEVWDHVLNHKCCMCLTTNAACAHPNMQHHSKIEIFSTSVSASGSLVSMDLIPSEIKDLGVIRRAVFASMYLPQECPNYWSLVSEFATLNSSQIKDIDYITMKAIIENLQLLNARAFSSDSELTKEIHGLKIHDQPLGIVLVSSNDKCGMCHGQLLTRNKSYGSVH